VLRRRHDRELWVLDTHRRPGHPCLCRSLPAVWWAESERLILGFGAHLDPTRGHSAGPRRRSTNWACRTGQGRRRPTRRRRQGLVRRRPPWPIGPTWPHRPTNRVDARPGRPGTPKGQRHPRRRTRPAAEIVKQAGLEEPWCLDQTRPDIGLNVVKVIVPGLRQFWPRWGPGRA
jgi:ribosomal protein S12 methylthiotransferase accessory factor